MRGGGPGTGFFLAMVLGLAASVPLRAAVIEHLSVHYSGAINMSLQAVIDAPVARVAAILNNTDDLASLLPGAASVRTMVGAPAGDRRLKIEMSGCLLFFCPSLTDVMDLRPIHDGFVAYTVPALSDFSAGCMRWHYGALSNGKTFLGVHAHLVPRIWVPPLIGPYLIVHKVEHQMRATVQRLERAARSGRLTPAKPPPPPPIPSFIF